MTTSHLKLGVNVDHVATLREVRGTVYPSPLDAARVCAEAGAHSITMHLREDRRHIQDADVYAIRKSGPLPLNLEMANAPDIVRIAMDLCPPEVCLVPEKREELTTEGGLDAKGQEAALRPTVAAMKEKGILISLFVEPDRAQLEACARLGVPCVELHTGTYCGAGAGGVERELKALIEGARVAHGLGLQVNAGHGINMENIGGILRIPYLDTLNIGHSIVARSVFTGLREAVREMLEAMARYRGGDA
jgi:pyridoxine 5-phosphate synthase